MKPPSNRSRFQTSNRHYHRYREDRHDWSQWVDPSPPASSRKRIVWIISLTVVGAALTAGAFLIQGS